MSHARYWTKFLCELSKYTATESLAATEENETIAVDKGSTDSEANIDDQDDSVETDDSTVHVAAAGDLGNSVAAAAGFVDSVSANY